MKSITFILFIAAFLNQAIGQNKIFSDFSESMLGKGNIQSELYYNGLPVLNSGGDLQSLVVRYGLNSTFELNTRISRKSISLFDQKFSGIIPISLGTKVYVYSSPNTNLYSHFSFLLPLTTGDFEAKKLGYLFDFMMHQRFNDIFSMEGSIGILQQLGASTPYLSFQGMLAVTEYLDLFSQLDFIYDDNNDNSWLRIGSKLWITEDIKLNVDYGFSLVSKYDDRVSIGVLARWLD